MLAFMTTTALRVMLRHAYTTFQYTIHKSSIHVHVRNKLSP